MGARLVRKTVEPEEDDIILMRDMRPLEVCVVVSEINNGHIVMRTASTAKFEIIDWSNSRADSCWTLRIELEVRRLRKGETYMLELN